MIIAIIPARGGSKAIPKKNIMDFCGKPLIAWSIEHAMSSKYIDEVYVSTDSNEIANISKKYGAKVIKRPKEISGDLSPSEDALKHVLNNIKKSSDKKIDYVVFLQATSPLREIIDINSAIKQIKSENSDSLFSAYDIGDFFIWKIINGKPQGINHDYNNRKMKQCVEKEYRENGSIYIFKPDILFEYNNRLGGKISIYEMDAWKSSQIDYYEDIVLTEFYMKKKILKKELSNKSLFNLNGKTVLITGAAGFFGKYITKGFLENGANVILMSRSDKLVDQVHKYRKEYGNDRINYYQVDFYDLDKLKKNLKLATEEHDIHILVNNAFDISSNTGFNTPSGKFDVSTYDQWKASFECGVYWAVLTTQIISDQYKKKKISGSIINVSSMYGIVSPSPKLYEGTSFFNPPAYSVSKAGLLALTRYTASFLGKYNIRCNAISPGPFSNTEDEGYNSVKNDDPFVKRLKDMTVINKIGHPNDLIGALIYLASDASSYVTGHNLVIDGGWTIK